MTALVLKKLLFLALGIAAISCLLACSDTSALASDKPCKNVEIVSARGSGRKLGEREMPRFIEQLKLRIESSTFTVNDYELGSERQGNYQYPAKAIIGSVEADIRGLGAQTSNGMGNDYGKSVKEGIDELEIYLLKRINKCPTTRFVLGGYSQGAQVMGQALGGFSSRILDKIEYVALFGDPKLYLPEGEGFNPPACNKNDPHHSNWRRIVPNCDTDDGTLGARKPYIPASMYDRVGLWCNNNDWICGSSKFAGNSSGHEKYAEDGGAIDDAARLIASRILKHEYLESHDTVELPVVKHGVTFLSKLDQPHQGQDVIFILDRAAESETTYNFRVQKMLSLADSYWKSGSRFGIVSICPNASNPRASYYVIDLLENGPNQRFGNMTGPEVLDMRKSDYSYCGTTRSSDYTYAVAMTAALDAPKWRNGAEKSIIFPSTYTVGNVSDPALLNYIKKRAIEIDPVNVYTVSPSGSPSGLFEEISDATGGRSITYDETQTTAEQAIQQTSDMVADRPIVRPSLSSFSANVGKPIILSVWSSLDEIDDHITYRWDYNADGVWDNMTSQPFGVATFSSTGEKLVHVEVTGSDGAKASTVIPVIVEEPEPESTADLTPPTDLGYTILATKDGMSTVRLNWQPRSTVYRYMLSIDGIQLGWLDNTRTSIELTDIDRTHEVTIGLQAYDQNLMFGDRTGVVVPPLPVEHAPQPRMSSTQIPEQQPQGPSQAVQPSVVFGSQTTEPEPTPFMRAQSRDEDSQPVSSSGDMTGLIIGAGILGLALVSVVYFYRRHGATLRK